jgi:hypothetical protein
MALLLGVMRDAERALDMLAAMYPDVASTVAPSDDDDDDREAVTHRAPITRREGFLGGHQRMACDADR